ncbi:uncharacterized protein LOC117654275 isoform X1 [Thrips palmi]|uniref:Uncharacterized protein LOC117654275 isoform X1 n=1 Tax=Thrips palmi TaxID=161013 RepID=A0A6P9AM50_THRPL|nr:uncharacterized protein LOC117654275 isoform X1 [Thrips palmi]
MILVAGLMPRMKDYVRRESDVSGILNQPLWSNMDVERRQDLIAQSHDEMAFWTLPDDFLLAVLGHLPTRELFTARLVCRRFRDLCLHRQLWKTRSLANDLFGSVSVDFGLRRAVLSLAPCLRRLSLSPGHCIRLAPFVPSVSQLNIDLAFYGEGQEITCDNAQDFINLVQRLSSLGGLTELGFCLALENPNSLLVQALLKTIYTISGLQSLFIGGEIPLAADISVDVKVEPSLKKINYRSLGDDACERVPFIGSLLKAHASTLEEVIVELHDVPLSPLQGSKKLRSLTIFPHEELPLLVDCPNLSTIEIVYSDRWVYPAGTIEFFRRAVSLRSVTFTCPVRDSLAPLVALAGSKAAKRVWMLDIFATSPDVITLLGISLYKFPSLRRLTFQGKVTDDFLRAVDPAATPNLTSLALDVCHDGSPCAHSWLHGPAIQDLFARNPRLGLHIENWYGKYGRDCSCRWCSWGCHSKLVEPKGGFSADYI